MYARLIEGFNDKLSFNRICEETNFIRNVPNDCYRVFCHHRPYLYPQSSLTRLIVRSVHFLSCVDTPRLVMVCCWFQAAILNKVLFQFDQSSDLTLHRNPLKRSV